MAKNNLVFEKDEKKSIIIAIVISIIVVIAVMCSFIAIHKYKLKHSQYSSVGNTQSTESKSVDGNAVKVKNQKELNAALEDKDVISILFETEKEETIVIPTGKYTDTEIELDAPYTNITNYGVFSKITIDRISADTWTESVSGNSFVLAADSSHIIVPEGVTVKSIENTVANSTLAAEIQGTVELLALEADDSITSIQIDGLVQQTLVHNRTNLSLSGKRTDITTVEVEYGADGTTIATAIPLQVSSFAGVSVTYSEGAEGSSLTVSASECIMSVQNDTTDVVNVSFSDGSTKEIAAGSSYTYEGNSTTGDNAASTGEPAADQTSQAGFGSESSAAGGASSSSSSSGSSGGSSRRSSSVSYGGSGTTGSSSSSGSNASGSNAATTATEGYTKEQVEKMIESAVKNATSGLLSTGEVEKMVADAVERAKEQATDGMITKDQAQELINATVKEALENAFKNNVIVSFVNPVTVYAGNVNSDKDKLKSIDEIGLPDVIEGRTESGDSVYVKVNRWINENNYSQNAIAGEYRFTAEIESGHYLAGNVIPQAKVYVGDAKRTYVYKDASYKDRVTVEEYTEKSDIGAVYGYYNIENHSAQKVYVGLSFMYFDGKGNIIPTLTDSWFGMYIAPENGWVAPMIRLPEDESYSDGVIIIDTYPAAGQVEESGVFASAVIDGDNASVVITNTVYGQKKVSDCEIVIMIVDGAENKVCQYETVKTSDIEEGINLWRERTLTYNLAGLQNVRCYVWQKGGYIEE